MCSNFTNLFSLFSPNFTQRIGGYAMCKLDFFLYNHAYWLHKRTCNCYMSEKRDGKPSFKNCLAFVALWQSALSLEELVNQRLNGRSPQVLREDATSQVNIVY
jgi:hypothetical protein